MRTASRMETIGTGSVLSGAGFGRHGAEHIRISYANSQASLTEAPRRIRAFVDGLGVG